MVTNNQVIRENQPTGENLVTSENTPAGDNSVISGNKPTGDNSIVGESSVGSYYWRCFVEVFHTVGGRTPTTSATANPQNHVPFLQVAHPQILFLDQVSRISLLNQAIAKIGVRGVFSDHQFSKKVHIFLLQNYLNNKLNTSTWFWIVL